MCCIFTSYKVAENIECEKIIVLHGASKLKAGNHKEPWSTHFLHHFI